jgi:hypothetical protein
MLDAVSNFLMFELEKRSMGIILYRMIQSALVPAFPFLSKPM